MVFIAVSVQQPNSGCSRYSSLSSNITIFNLQKELLNQSLGSAASRLLPSQLSALSNWENLPPGLAQRFGQQAMNSGTLSPDVLNSLHKFFKVDSMDVKPESNS